MEKIHNGGDNPHRMPLMISKEMALKWLDNSTSEDEIKEILDYKISAEELTAHPVFTVRGKNKLTGPEIIEPYNWEGYTLELDC